jgi:hypothetical protein
MPKFYRARIIDGVYRRYMLSHAIIVTIRQAFCQGLSAYGCLFLGGIECKWAQIAGISGAVADPDVTVNGFILALQAAESA